MWPEIRKSGTVPFCNNERNKYNVTVLHFPSGLSACCSWCVVCIQHPPSQTPLSMNVNCRHSSLFLVCLGELRKLVHRDYLHTQLYLLLYTTGHRHLHLHTKAVLLAIVFWGEGLKEMKASTLEPIADLWTQNVPSMAISSFTATGTSR